MIIIEEIKPVFTTVVTTAERYTNEDCVGTLLDPKQVSGAIKEIQKVVAVGNDVRCVKVGDMVAINPIRYVHPKHKRDENSLRADMQEYTVENVIDIPTLDMDGTMYLKIDERDVDFIVTKYREEKSVLVKPATIVS